MKKKLLPLVLLLPLGVFAQEAKPEVAAPKPLKWEVGYNNTLAFAGDMGKTFYDDVLFIGRNSVSVYRNFSGAQVGLLVEGGVFGLNEGWWMSPQAVVNYKVPFKRLYAYGGGVAGYVSEQYTIHTVDRKYNGFITGLHAGAVYSLGKRFGINLEGGVRFKHTTASVITENNPAPGGGIIVTTEKSGYTDLYFPLSLGVRYKF